MKFTKLVVLTVVLANITFAWADDPMSVGQFSHAAMDPLGVLAHVFYTIFYIAGGSLLMGSLVKFKEYRRNPNRAAMAQQVSWLVFGLIFIATPFIVQLSRGATLLS